MTKKDLLETQQVAAECDEVCRQRLREMIGTCAEDLEEDLIVTLLKDRSGRPFKAR